MTLEQIKIRQETINENLSALLDDTTTIVERLIGEQTKADLKGEIIPCSGLLGEIANRQYTTERFISQLFELRQILASGVYSPEVNEVVTMSGICSAREEGVRTY